MESKGFIMLKKQNPAYAAVEIPSVAAIYAPQLFQGISGEVTVAESPTTRDSITGARPRPANEAPKIFPGRAMDMY